jgi:hypothetical protein
MSAMTNALKPEWQDIPEHLIIADLPESLQYLLQLLPLQAVLTMVEAYGGNRLYIPLYPQPDHGLGKLIGIEAAKAMASFGGGSVLEIPLVTKIQQRIRHTAVLKSLAGGVSKRETARAFGMTERTVRNICNKYRT